MLFIGGPNDGARHMVEVRAYFKVPVPKHVDWKTAFKDMRADIQFEIFVYKLESFFGFNVYVDPTMKPPDIIQRLLNNYYPEIESVQ